jgi:hypothetical protein
LFPGTARIVLASRMMADVSERRRGKLKIKEKETPRLDAEL